MNNQFRRLSSQQVKLEDFVVNGILDDENGGFLLTCPDPLCPWSAYDTVRSISTLLDWAREHKKSHRRESNE